MLEKEGEIQRRSATRANDERGQSSDRETLHVEVLEVLQKRINDERTGNTDTVSPNHSQERHAAEIKAMDEAALGRFKRVPLDGFSIDLPEPKTFKFNWTIAPVPLKDEESMAGNVVRKRVWVA